MSAPADGQVRRRPGPRRRAARRLQRAVAAAGLMAAAAAWAQVPVPLPGPPLELRAEPAGGRAAARAASAASVPDGPAAASTPGGARTAAAASAVAVVAAVTDPPTLLRVELPRDSGHHIADRVIYRALIDSPRGWQIDRDGLPARERNDEPLELQGHRFVAAEGECRDCRWLELDWQIFRAPTRMGEDLTLPPTPVRLRRERDIVTLTLPPALLSVFPLVPWESRRDWLESQRPGWQAEALDVATPLRQAGAAAGIGLLGLLGWGWTTGRLGRLHRRPFAEAWRALRRHPGARDQAADDAALARWHAAFDATAGEVVLADDLDRFFRRHPIHAPQAEAVAEVFAASRRRFFLEPGEAQRPGRAAGAAPGLSVGRLLEVLRALADAEGVAPRGAAGRAGEPVAARGPAPSVAGRAG